MAARVDAAGNVAGRYEGERPGLPAVLLGSHIDTVRDAGRYDGNLGVLAAIQAVAELHATAERLPFAIEVLAFGDEEGVRFPTRWPAAAPSPAPSTRDARRPRRGRRDPPRGARAASAATPPAIPGDRPPARRRRWPMSRSISSRARCSRPKTCRSASSPRSTARAGSRIEVTGEAGHAGTVPMGLRKDALAAAAEMVLAVERRASARAGAGRAPSAGSRSLPAPSTSSRARPASRSTCARPTTPIRTEAVADLERTSATSPPAAASRVQVERTYDEPAARLRPGAHRRSSQPRSSAPGSARAACRAAPAMTAWPWRPCARSACCSSAARAGSATIPPS